MTRHKSTNIIGDLKKYFTSEEKAANAILHQLQAIKITNKAFCGIDKANTRYTSVQTAILLILFPLAAIKDISHYSQSALYKAISCGKDVFYRFEKNSSIDWRKLLYSINLQIIKRVETHAAPDENRIRCLIADDTDLPKRGRHFERLSRIFSHVTKTYNHGFKGLFLCLHDGKSLFSLDFSLHGEKGKDPKRPYGLTRKEAKRLYSKKREASSAGQKRMDEYAMTKNAMLLRMLRTAIAKGIRFDYMLTDSWFTNYELVNFIATRHIICHFLGMVKKAKTKYLYKGKELTFNQIHNSLKHSKKMSFSKSLRAWHYEAEVELKGLKVKLFFCRRTKHGDWAGMLTTNTSLDFESAYKIYATRWTIEVFFKECKQYLRLGKNESRDFDAQIASNSVTILQYNILSSVKRFDSYETLGGLFRDIQSNLLELTVKERIWLILLELAAELAETLDETPEFIMQNILSGNERFTKSLNLECLAMSG